MTVAQSTSELFTFSGSSVDLDQFESDYNTVLDQIDGIVEDANYRGVNLLSGDDMTTFKIDELVVAGPSNAPATSARGGWLTGAHQHTACIYSQRDIHPYTYMHAYIRMCCSCLLPVLPASPNHLGGLGSLAEDGYGIEDVEIPQCMSACICAGSYA